MGLYVRRDEQRTKLQERIAADLRVKAKEGGELEPEPVIDGVERSNYIENTKVSSGLLGVWLVLGVISVGVIIFLIIRSR